MCLADAMVTYFVTKMVSTPLILDCAGKTLEVLAKNGLKVLKKCSNSQNCAQKVLKAVNSYL